MALTNKKPASWRVFYWFNLAQVVRKQGKERLNLCSNTRDVSRWTTSSREVK